MEELYRIWDRLLFNVLPKIAVESAAYLFYSVLALPNISRKL
jgi:hypothetical protein